MTLSVMYIKIEDNPVSTLDNSNKLNVPRCALKRLLLDGTEASPEGLQVPAAATTGGEGRTVGEKDLQELGEEVDLERNYQGADDLIDQNYFKDEELITVEEETVGEGSRGQLQEDIEEVLSLLSSSSRKVDKETIVAHLKFFTGHPSRVRSTVAELSVQRQDSPDSPVIVKEVSWEEGGGE